MAMSSTTQKAARGKVARVLAPLALVAVAVAVAVVVSSTLSGSESGGDPDRPRSERAGEQRDRERAQPEEAYVVQPGDTLSGIAEKTGVPIERLIRLNPDLDPQTLNSGETVKLR